MRTPFVAGNWKMNSNSQEMESLIQALLEKIGEKCKITVAICPPFPYLFGASRLLDGSSLYLGAQNMHQEPKGAYTGEVSAAMIKDAGCRFVILGHSERRQYFGESDELIALKINKALEAGLDPIVCVGETLEQREAGETRKVVLSQIQGCLGGLSAEQMDKVTIAYEPIWAIGTGKTATPEQAQDVHAMIREWLKSHFSESVAEQTVIQYGGSVKPDNAAVLLSQPDIDGALVGGASLKADSFAAIIEAA